MNDILAAATAAHHAGLNPFPARTDGTKAPDGRWKAYQSERLELGQLAKLFKDHPNLGLICGEINDRVICLEVEGRFMSEWPTIRERLRKAGLWDEVERWMNGYSETSPSGGLHILVRLGGTDPLPGNQKIAMAPTDRPGVLDTLIETRGEGGYIVVAPSGGTTDAEGREWKMVRGGFDSIATATPEAWDAVLTLLHSFDESPPSPEPPPATRPPRLGGGWLAEALEAVPAIQDALSDAGWTYVRTDGMGQLWRRPGKDRGVSGRVNQSGRLQVFSTSTPFPATKQTFDALDVQLTCETGQVPTLDQRTERLRGLRQTPEAPSATITTASPKDEGGHRSVPPTNLGDEFWESTPFLRQLRAAAHSNLRSPDGVWEAFKAFYAATVPHNFLLPGQGTLDYIALVVGPSGTGKTRSKNLALQLLPEEAFQIEGVTLGLPPGTGEGMVEWYLKRDDKGKQELVNRGGGFYVDEGKWLLDVHGRTGNTTVQMLKQMWSGELTGSLNASSDRKRILPPRAVRGGVLIAATPDIFAAFLQGGLEEGGFPQRVSVGSATHPDIGDLDFEWDNSRLDVAIYDHNKYGSNSGITYALEYEPELSNWQRSREIARLRGEAVSTADGHSDFAQLKTAALIALMSGEMTVTMQHLHLASLDWATTRILREEALAKSRSVYEDSARAAGRRRVLEDEAEDAMRLERAALSIARLVSKSNAPVAKKTIRDGIAANMRKRYGLDWSESLDLAISRGWVKEDGGTYSKGPVSVAKGG